MKFACLTPGIIAPPGREDRDNDKDVCRFFGAPAVPGSFFPSKYSK